MAQPAWDDTSVGGTMVRGALWLLQVVGEGNTFTKNQLREAFPGVSQVDRRIRDLRDYGWVVYSSSEDATLLREDQRFVHAGVPVWDRNARLANSPDSAISNKDRHLTLARDGYMCTLCGIAGGETYPDDSLMTAVLGVSRRIQQGIGGQQRQLLVTECKRCRSGGPSTPLSPDEALAVASELDADDMRRLQRWLERGRRGATQLDRAWAAYLRVPIDDRHLVLEALQAQR